MPYWELNDAQSSATVIQNKLAWFLEPSAIHSAFTYSSAFNEVPTPSGLTGITSRVSMVNYDSRVYACGGFTHNWMIDEHYRALRLGMVAPTAKPTLAVGAGAIVQIGYVSFYDAHTGERSPLSVGSAPVTGDVSRTWTTFPTEEPAATIKIPGTTAANASTTITGSNTTFTRLRIGDRLAVSSAATTWGIITAIASDTSLTVDRALGDGTTQTITIKKAPRATHVEFWVSVDGADPRLAVRRRLGTTTLVESTATLSLGEAAPEDFTQFPRCSFCTIYHDRLVMAGDKHNPDTVYLSQTFFPERYADLSFKTRNGETITGLAVQGDKLMVFTAGTTYAIQGYDDDDISMVLVDSDLGAFNHWAIVSIHGNLWVPNEKSIFLFNGTYHNVLKDRQTEWRKDYYTNKAHFDSASFAFTDPEDYTYHFVVRTVELGSAFSATRYVTSMPTVGTVDASYSSIDTVVWVADYSMASPELSGGFQQPNWTTDTYLGTMMCAANLRLPNSGYSRVFMGWDDGYVRRFDNQQTNDDGDSVTLYIRTGHYNMGDPGGDVEEGRTFFRMWTHVMSESVAWNLWVLGGEAHAWISDIPTNASNGIYFAESVPASFFQSGGNTYAPLTVHSHILHRVSGRGITVVITAANACRSDLIRYIFEFKGFGGCHTIGPNTRGFYK